VAGYGAPGIARATLELEAVIENAIRDDPPARAPSDQTSSNRSNSLQRFLKLTLT
jgi:hypothetical protein